GDDTRRARLETAREIRRQTFRLIGELRVSVGFQNYLAQQHGLDGTRRIKIGPAPYPETFDGHAGYILRHAERHHDLRNSAGKCASHEAYAAERNDESGAALNFAERHGGRLSDDAICFEPLRRFFAELRNIDAHRDTALG